MNNTKLNELCSWKGNDNFRVTNWKVFSSFIWTFLHISATKAN